MRQLFLDCDGVLADFDKGFEDLFGWKQDRTNPRVSQKDMWYKIRTTNKFFENLDLLPDARELYEEVKHLRPIILTGCPFGDWAPVHKMKWRDKHFPGVPMITCMAKDKVDYAQVNDVLIDDYSKHRETWQNGGGIFIHHKNTKDSLQQLSNIW